MLNYYDWVLRTMSSYSPYITLSLTAGPWGLCSGIEHALYRSGDGTVWKTAASALTVCRLFPLAAAVAAGRPLDRQLTYWRTQLADAPPFLDLPTDAPRPPQSSHRGERLVFAFPASLTQALKVLSHHEGVTLFMTLLAAFQIVLARYSGQRDILVGTP